MPEIKRVLYTGLDPSHYRSAGQLTHCPLIQIAPRPLSDPAIQQAFQLFHSYTHVIVTSKSSVQILHDYLPRLDLSIEAWKRKTTVAVGRATAARLQACGIRPALVAKQETAEGLVAELQCLSLESARIFWPHSAQARPVLTDFFQQRRLCFQTCALYDTNPCHPPILPCLDEFDEIVFTSPSTVRAFMSFFGSLPAHKTLISIGPITEMYVREQLALYTEKH